VSPREEAAVYVLPASFGQDRLWLLHQLAPESTAYHLAAGLRLRGPLDVAMLRRAVASVIARHEALRTTFGLADSGALVQLIHESGGVELAECGVTEAEVANRATALATRPFDLSTGPLLRTELCRVSDDDHRLLFVVHHIVADGWSLPLLLGELGEFYRAGRTGTPCRLPILPIQYADWAVWQRESATGDGASPAYWRDQLAGAGPVELPTDRPRPAIPRSRGAELPVQIPPAIAAAVRQVATRARATPFMVLLAALAATLSRWCRQDDLIIGTPASGRTVREAEGLVGYFINTLPLRIDLSGDPTFGGLLDRVRSLCLGAYAHQDLPYERMVELAGRRQLVTAMLAMREPLPTIWPEVPELRIEQFPVPTGGAQFDLTFFLNPSADGGYAGEASYDRELFDASTITEMRESFATLLAAATVDPARPVRRLDAVPAASRRRLRVEASGAATPPVGAGRLHAAFEATVAASPDAVAVRDEQGSLSYAELDRRANRLAWFLHRLGAGPGDLVGVCVPRCAAMVVALLGVLKSGAAYLPLDADYPAERLRYMVADSGARLVLVTPATAAALAGVSARLLGLDADAITRCPANPPPSAATPGDLAYVIYTSGSTGRPKGAMNEHRAVTNRIAWALLEYPLQAGEAIMQKTPLGFDVSGWEVHWPLAAGARMVLARPGGHRDPDYLVDLIRAEAVTTVHFVPSMLTAFLGTERVRECDGVLRRILCSGEELPRELANRCRRLLPTVELHNLYGPTETAIEVTAARVEADPAGCRVPMGRPIAGTTAFVLDPSGELAPPGARGELHIGGIAVGRGYHGRPGLTAQRFVPDPTGTGTRLYRTGDLVRWRSDGALEFLGRLDQQIKIRGHRIEISEIEAVLAEHPQVAATAVTAAGSGEGAYLVGYVVPSGPRLTVDLRAYLRARLPEPMVPAYVMTLGELPVSANGKLDRARLPVPAPPSRAGGAEPPCGPTEELLALIWAEVLGLEQVGVQEDFYDLGGNSLRAVTVLNRAREAGLRVPIALLLGSHTIRDLARSSASQGNSQCSNRDGRP
jgi:amino acid adenylation domain-containing protein